MTLFFMKQIGLINESNGGFKMHNVWIELKFRRFNGTCSWEMCKLFLHNFTNWFTQVFNENVLSIWVWKIEATTIHNDKMWNLDLCYCLEPNMQSPLLWTEDFDTWTAGVSDRVK